MKKEEEKSRSNQRLGDKVPIPGSYQYDAYYKAGRIQRFWHVTRLEESKAALAVTSGDTVLDIGCGSGLLASFIAGNKDVKVLGIDANPSAIGFCRDTYRLPNLSFEQKTTEDIRFNENSFSRIALLEVIEHISTEQAVKLLGTIQDLLKPGGRLVISTPNKKSCWPLIEWLMDKLKLAPRMGRDQHEILYTRKKLIALAAGAGLECVSQKTLFFISPWIAFFSPRLAKLVHKMGMKLHSKPGSLLLLTFQK
ncbi:MAG: methyltransferase domain-containing protein [Chitinophagaceae bacterium]